jgi:hypothetical protein
MTEHGAGGDAGPSVWRRLVWVAIAAATLTGCSLSGPTTTSLREEWAARLQFSGSVELIAGGHDAEQTPEGPLPALAWREYGVDATWDELVAYFESELRDREWEDGGGSSGGPSTQELDAVAWHKGDRILSLAHRRNTLAPDASGTYAMIYRVTLIGQGVPSE